MTRVLKKIGRLFVGVAILGALVAGVFLFPGAVDPDGKITGRGRSIIVAGGVMLVLAFVGDGKTARTQDKPS